MKLFYHTEKKDMIGWFFLVISSLIFFGLKISQLTFRFGDGNEYVYMASLLGQGILPYRDYFFVDPPVLILVLSFLHLVLNKTPILFQTVPVVLEIINATLLFLYLKKINNKLSFFAPVLYLFSFTVLATSDYITGVQLVICFCWFALLCMEYKKSFISGLFWGLAVCTKLYAIPLIVGWFIVTYFQKDKKQLVTLLIGFIVACLILLLPFIIMDFSHVVSYIILFHFNRPLGIDKNLIYQYFFQHEWLLLIGAFIGIVVGKKKLLFPFLFILIFFLIFPDLYYLYLDTLIAFLIFFFIEGLSALYSDYKISKELMGGIVILCYLFMLFNWFDYSNNLIPKGKFSNAIEIAEGIKKLPKHYPLYGSYEIVPLLALLSNRLIINNYVDTNPQGFTSFGQNKTIISKQVVERGSYIIGRINKVGNDVRGFEGYFDTEMFKK